MEITKQEKREVLEARLKTFRRQHYEQRVDHYIATNISKNAEAAANFQDISDKLAAAITWIEAELAELDVDE